VRVASYTPSALITDGGDRLPGRMARGEERDAAGRSQGRRSSATVAH
jgi:hypothetical protein